MKSFKKVINIILLVIVITILPLVVFTFLSSKVNLLGIQSFVVLTGSMSPTIPAGSVLYTNEKSRYSAGDVISFRRDGVVVTHRVVEVGEGGYATKGDANEARDSDVVARGEVLGSTFFHVPYVGNFMLYLRTLPGFLLFVILPGVLFISFELWNIKNHIVEKTKKDIMGDIKML